jgi:hypothetical protein
LRDEREAERAVLSGTMAAHGTPASAGRAHRCPQFGVDRKSYARSEPYRLRPHNGPRA